MRRFEGFQSSLQITRHLLSERLKKLVRFGILRRVPYSEAPKRYEYILTQKGLDLYPIIMAMVHWGDIHMGDERGRPLLHQHKTCGKDVRPGDGLLGMRRAVACEAGACAPGPGRQRPSLRPALSRTPDRRKPRLH